MRFQRAVLSIDLQDIPERGNRLPAHTVMRTGGEVQSMELCAVLTLPFLKITAKGTTSEWLVPLDKVESLEAAPR